ncbi:MAG: 4Fe-4S dicluster domain-containing protein [Actinomycetota bacterium]
MVENKETQSPSISIDSSRCIACNECVEVCPQSRNAEYPVYEISGEDRPPRVANPENCIACLSCEKACRALAIKVGVPAKNKVTGLEDVRAYKKSRLMF